MQRRAIAIRGVVQGVGFRPFVYGLATRLALGGFVQNRVGEVWIEVEGEAPALERFLATLVDSPPPLAWIENLSWQPRPSCGDRHFRIENSAAGPPGPAFLSPDVAVCDDCLAELFDSSNRRYRYPFINCTNCGPRLTIVTGAPYDRERTTMTAFAMCSPCRAEYEDPADRRFHAQPIACWSCGPHLQSLTADGRKIETGDPLGAFATALRAGRIGALKGLGGYHLVCDAQREEVVADLRRRKQRDEKPFAVMVCDEQAAETLCEVHPAERKLLLSLRRPIVLLRRQATSAIAESVAPRSPHLGIMLPYTPLHYLLLREMDVPLVMTSGNRADEPIAHDDGDALQRLAGIADVFLTNNRPIHVRCDDSVTRVVSGAELPVRRSRGQAPQPIALPVACRRPTLAVGGQFKGTFALANGRHAFVSHHLGDLDHLEAFRAFERDIELYQELLTIHPDQIVHDLHPDYASTRYALKRPAVHRTAVQHHHAHLASCMAENGLTGSVMGVTFDGTGYGSDGTIWGGEFLVGGYREVRRAAHLRYVGMPGGDQAIRAPWRMALAHLIDAGADDQRLRQRLPGSEVRLVGQMLAKQLQTPTTTSAARLFDAVAALATSRDRVSYEGQAAVELEWLATECFTDGAYPFEVTEQDPMVVDTRPLIRGVVQDIGRGAAPPEIARRFHTTMVELIATVCGRLRDATGLNRVALSGGVFMNALLTAEVLSRLTKDGFHVYRHRLVPPNDGGLSLGQLAVAAAVMA